MTRVRSLIATLLTISLGAVSGPLLLAQDSAQPVRFGINSFLGNLRHSEVRPPTTKATPEDRTNYLDQVRDLGVTTIRETFMNWAEIEPQRGKGYLYADFDDIARKASARGIEIVAIAFPFPPWATGLREVQKDDYVFMGLLPRRSYESDFRRFVRTTVDRYCGCKADSLHLSMPIRQWIFFNEPDITKADPDEYAHWLKIFYEEVKSADPGAKVIAPAVATAGLAFGIARIDTIPPTFLTSVLNSKELKGPAYPYFDILDFHCYPIVYGPSTGLYAFNAAYGYVRETLQVHNLHLEVRLTETGDNSANFSVQADNDIKILVHAASVGVSRVYLHGLWDYAAPEVWGVLENTPSGKVPIRKPSFYAYQTLLHKMGDNRGAQFLGPGRYRVLLPANKVMYVFWAEGPNTGPPSFLRGHVIVTDLSGKETTMRAGDLKLSGHPVFVQQVD